MQASSGLREHQSSTPDGAGRDPASERFAKQAKDYGIRYLYHITHIDNLKSIAERGLLSHDRAHRRGGPVDISDPDVNRRRARRNDPFFKRPLHEYVPLFFRPRNPMLFVRRDEQRRLAILCIDANVLCLYGTVFTDGNAANAATKFFRDTQHLDQLDWDCINADYWTGYADGKRKRAAEVLVPDMVKLELVRWVVLNNEEAAEVACEAMPSVADRVCVRPRWFFNV